MRIYVSESNYVCLMIEVIDNDGEISHTLSEAKSLALSLEAKAKMIREMIDKAQIVSTTLNGKAPS